MLELRDSLLRFLESAISGENGYRKHLSPHHIDLSSPASKDYTAPVIRQQLGVEVAEKTPLAGHTAIYLYLEKLVNNQREKFTRFSGYAQAVIELRATNDRADDLERTTEVYTEALLAAVVGMTPVSQGCYFTGSYEVDFGPVKRGGRNFQQITKIRLRVEFKRP
jgi:hypothetical protein